MQTQLSTLARAIGAIGAADFAAVTANAVRDFMDFELTAVIVHRRQDRPALMFDNFDAAGCRRGLETYLGVTHAINPMLERGPPCGALRARDFAIRTGGIDDGLRSYLVESPDEELGFRTIGWPEKLEEVGLYFEACGGVIELSLYRERGQTPAPSERLRDLESLGAPLAAAFDRSTALARGGGVKNERFASVLSPRERAVRDLMLLGCSSEAIGLRLDLSRHTVKDYRKQIFRKLGISSLAELFSLGAPP